MRGLWESLGLLHNKEIGRCLAKRQNQTLWTLQCWELGAFAALNDLRPVLRIQWWLNLRTEVGEQTLLRDERNVIAILFRFLIWARG